ncbi:HECT domain-containing protein [Hamiltosporidium tvaerminnensis]|uniref:HECT-type E3 ubiquitin transferase n=1 Tax=Hamiltosporidium tvaerminnensis TaxID=1176355 RepID=A0A4Q9M1E0_9MICR|nr:HECT domain-containing protein [Hamiltosporidium tvaerminnensis]
METIHTSTSNKTRNQKMSILIASLCLKEDISDIFMTSDDPFSISKIGKICILKWNIVLDKYEKTLSGYRNQHFSNNIQIKQFNGAIKKKVLFIFKFLIYIMKNTFNHELYIIDNLHSDYLNSYDLDISYNSFLFHNEYCNGFSDSFNEISVKYFNSQNFSFYLEKDIQINQQKELKENRIIFSFNENQNLETFKKAIKDCLKSNKTPINIYEVHKNFKEFSVCNLQILRYLYYEKTDFQKLLSIEILANILTAKFYYTYKLELLLFCMQNFLIANFDDTVLASLQILAENVLLISKCKYNQENLISNQKLIKEILEKYQRFPYRFRSEKYKLLFTKFFIILNFLYSDSKIPEKDYISIREFNFVDICRFLPYILNILYNNAFFITFVDNIFLKSNTEHLVNSLFDLIDLESTNKSIPFENVIQTELYCDFKSRLTWLFRLYRKVIIHISDSELYDEHERLISLFLKKACFIVKNFYRYDFTFVDFINKNIIKILTKMNAKNVSEFEVTTLEILFDYCIRKRMCFTVTACKNVLYLGILITSSRFYNNFPCFIQELLDLYLKSLEFSIFLNIFPRISTCIQSNAVNFLKYHREFIINFDQIIDNLSLKEACENTELNVYVNLIKHCRKSLQTIETHIFFLKKNDKNTLKRLFYDEFRLFFYLKFIYNILWLKNIVLKAEIKYNLHRLINIPKKCYKKENIHLFKFINRLALCKINPMFSFSLYMTETTTYDISEFQTQILNACYTHNINMLSTHEFLFEMMMGLEYISTDLYYVFSHTDITSKFNLVKKHIELVSLIYEKIVSIYTPKWIQYNSLEVTVNDLLSHYDTIYSSEKNFIESLKEHIYVLIYQNIMFLEQMPFIMHSNNPTEYISYIDLLHKISLFTTDYDPNILFIYYKYIKCLSIEIFELKLDNLIYLLKFYTQQLNKIPRKSPLEFYTDNNIVYLIILKFLMNMNNLKTDLIDFNLPKILNLMIENVCLFSEYYSHIFLQHIPLLKNIEKSISKLHMFIKISDLILLIENQLMNPNSQAQALEITESRYLYFFLIGCFENFYYLDFFIEAQKKFDYFFLFIFNQVNRITNPKKHFYKKPNSVLEYLKILKTNINTNIENNKNMIYNKESLLFSDIVNVSNDPKEVLLYLISLIRLANYSKQISKIDIYHYFKTEIGFKYCESIIGNVLNTKNQILEYAYTCLRNLFEDEFYLISSFAYVLDSYTKLPKNIFEYFNQKMVYKSEVCINYDNFSSLITEDDMKLKIEILQDMIMIIAQEQHSYRIITLQFLSEIISTFPSLLHFIEKETIDEFLNNFISNKIFDDFISLNNSFRWSLDFRYGYFITVTLYRGDLCYVEYVIEKICVLAKIKDFDYSYNLFSLIYKILLSEICCCKYIQYLNTINHDFYDENCRFNFEKRKKEIYHIFLSNGILETLVNKFEQNLCSSSHIIMLHNCLLKLLNIFLSYINCGNIKFLEKYLMSSIFQCYLPSLYNIFCHISFSLINDFNIYEISFLENSDSLEYINISRNELTNLKNIDFGYIMKYHIGIGDFSDYKKIIFSNSEIDSKIVNFYAENINDIKTVIGISIWKNSDEQIYDNLKNKLKRYNLSEDVHEMIYSRLILSEERADFRKFDKKKIEWVFKYEDFIREKYVSKICKKASLDEKNKDGCLSTYTSSNLDVKTVCNKLLCDLYILPVKECAFELIEIIKNLILLDVNKTFDEDFLKYYCTQVSRLNSRTQDSYFNENPLKFVCDKMQSYSDDSVLELLLFESLYLHVNTDRLPIDSIKLKNAQDSLTSNASKSKNVSQNILYQILCNQKKIIDSHLTLFNIYLYYCDKIGFLLLKGYFAEDETILRAKSIFCKYDRFLNSFDLASIPFKQNDIDYIYKSLEYIATSPLFIFFRDFNSYKNETIVFLFKKYLEIIAKCCQVYSYVRNRIPNDIDLIEYTNKFIFHDFMSFIFGISNKIYFPNSEQIYDLISFYLKVKTIFHDNFDLLSSFKYISLETKIMFLTRPTYFSDSVAYSAFYLLINPKNIIESTINFFETKSTEEILCENWMAKFTTEYGEGIGPLYEFFLLYSKAINENIYFMPFRTNDPVSIFALSDTEEHNKIQKIYYYTGIIMAKSIIMNSVMGLEFIESFYLFLAQEKFCIEDFKNIDREFYENYVSLRDVEDVDSLDLDFTVLAAVNGELKMFCLSEDGYSKRLTKENVEDYIQKNTEFKIYKGMKDYLDKLKEGFNLIFPNTLHNFFSYDDLKIMVEDKKELNITEWKSNTKYSGVYYSEHPTIIWFWNLLTGFDDSERHKVLKFITGLDKLPTGGFKSYKFIENPFTIVPIFSKDSLPSASTCFNLLNLPLYDNEDSLKEKMRTAITVDYYGSS